MSRISYIAAIAVISALLGFLTVIAVVPIAFSGEESIRFSLSWFVYGLPAIALLSLASVIIQQLYIQTNSLHRRAAVLLGNVLVVTIASLLVAWLY